MPAPFVQPADDLFFGAVVEGLVSGNRRFVRRDWLAADLAQELSDPQSRLVLLVAEPGAGKSAFIAQLAHENPAWQRYFIRRDQNAALADVSAKSLLMRVGFQLAAWCPELFDPHELKIVVKQDVDQDAPSSKVVGVDAGRLHASPFLERVVEIQQHVRQHNGQLVGLRVEDLVVESRLLTTDDLFDLAIVRPARALAQRDPTRRIVVLVDALDEISHRPATEDILTWLANCPALPSNVRFVLTSRDEEDGLAMLRAKQAAQLRELEIAETNPRVVDDIACLVDQLVQEPALQDVFAEAEGGAYHFAQEVMAKASGNIGYVDALARGIDSALLEAASGDEVVAAAARRTLVELVALKELPTQLHGLYALFLLQIKAGVSRMRVEVTDAETAETYEKPSWPALFVPILGVLTVAEAPLEAALLYRLADIRADRPWFDDALARLRQFLDVVDGRYRFYHSTVAEFLAATGSKSLSQGLAVDAPGWHGRIANHIWTSCAGRWERCDGYALSALASHLYKAGQFDRLFELASPGWMTARAMGQYGAYQAFLSDLLLIGESLKNRAAQEGCPPALLAMALRVMAIHAGVQAVSGSWAPALIAEAAKRGLWSPAHAVRVAAQVPESRQRARAFMQLLQAGALPPAVRPQAAKQGVAALLAASQGYDRAFVHVAIELAPLLERQEDLDMAWEAVKKIRFKWIEWRAQAKAALAVRYTSQAARRGAVSEALEDALANDEAHEEVPFRILAPYLTDSLLERALTAGRNSRHVIEAVGPHVPEAMLPRLLALTQEFGAPVDRAVAFAGFARRLPSDSRRQLWCGFLAAVDDERLPRMLNRIGDALRDDVLQEGALERVLAVEKKRRRRESMVALAPWLGGPAAKTALAATATMGKASKLRDVLAALAPLLEGPSRDLAVAGALAFGDPGDAAVLRAVLACMSDEQVQAAHDCVQAWSERDRPAGLAALLPRLGVDAALACSDAISSIDDAAGFAALVNALPSATRDALMLPLWTAASSFDEDERDLTMGAVLAHLHESALRKLLTPSITIGDEEDDFGELRRAIDEQLRAPAQAKAPPAQAERPPSEGEVAAALHRLQQEDAYAWGSVDSELEALAPYLTAELRSRALGLAIEMFQDGKTGSLIALADGLDAAGRRRALQVAVEDPHPTSDIFRSSVRKEPEVLEGQARLIAALAPRLDAGQREAALAKARKLEGSENRIVALAALSARVDPTQREALVDEALSATDGLYDAWQVFPMLAEAAGSDGHARVVSAAGALWAPNARARALAALRPIAHDQARLDEMIRTALIEHFLDVESGNFLLEEVRDEWLPELGRHDGVLAALQEQLRALQEDWVWH